MMIFLLASTAVLTLALNLMLTNYLLKEKLNASHALLRENEVVHFSLTPHTREDVSGDTQLLETQILPKDNG